MSLKKLKLSIVCLGLFLLMTPYVSAQISQMRFFSPYPEDQFGGGAYMNEGFYGSVGAGLITISQPSSTRIGHEYGSLADTPYLISRTAGGSFTAIKTTNQITTDVLESDFTSASQFEIGNRRGHHGWSLKGTIVTPQRLRHEGIDAAINILDPQTVLLDEYTDGAANYYVWADDKFVSMATYEAYNQGRIGHLWALIDLFGGQTSDHSYSGDASSGGGGGDGDEDIQYAFAPIPIIFDAYTLNTKVNTWCVEAMYTYRFHPFRIGMFEFLAGVKYHVFDDKMEFFAHATTKTSSHYTNTIVNILNKGGSTVVTPSGNISADSQEYDEYNEESDSFSGADLGYSSWNFDADNQIIGPQIGGRYTLSNNRWRVSGEGTFFAGFNRQNLSGNGYLGLKYESSQSGDLSDTGGIPLNSPINTVANSFAYSKHFNQWSPGANVKVEAAWHWTQVVSFKVGYDFTYLANIARSTTINDYRINADGSYFGVRDDKRLRHEDTLIHGVMFTVQINK
ncbi:MAG: BBP7 family outer membrane beta-barrel protein [Thermoguttaceae bacterium]|jgi:hypothetical protein